MNASSNSSCADDKSKQEFKFEVPVIDIKLDRSDTSVETSGKINSNYDNTRSDYRTVNKDQLGTEVKRVPIIFEDPKINDKYLNNDTTVLNDLATNKSIESGIAVNPLDTKKTYVLVFENNRDSNKTENVIDLDDENENVIDRNTNETGLSDVINLDKKNTHSKRDKNITENVIDLEDETEDVIVSNTNASNLDGVKHIDGNNTDSEDGIYIIVSDENKTDTENTIILDIDEINENTGQPKLDVIDVEKETHCSQLPNSTVKLKKNGTLLEKLDKDSILWPLIEKCLNMYNAYGISRVINKTLLAIYSNVNEEYKMSDEFRKVLTRTLMNLDLEPERKFSHLNNLCDTLRRHIIKKRVPFITLERKDKAQSTSRIPAKRRVDAVIDLEDDVMQTTQTMGTVKRRRKIHPIGKVFPPIDLDEDSSSDVIINDTCYDTNDVILIPDDTTNKENSKCKISKRKRITPMTITNERTIKQINTSKNLVINSTEPQAFIKPISEKPTQVRIQNIESHIAHLKKQLEILEEAEVTTDTVHSPYVEGERIKTFILKLYKQLCQLTGTEVRKRHQVRLKVVPGHPEGPVRCLEEFLNANIDMDGNPPFPDMQDVMKCVEDANTRYTMHWSRSQILGEARALFTQLGRTMQKRRQKREWKDLMSFVKQEVPDPADEDPQLQARLTQNTHIAKQKETDLIERFSKLEHGIILQDNPRMSMEQSESDQDSDIDTPVNNIPSSVPPDNINATEVTDNNIEISKSASKVAATNRYGSTLTVCDGNIVLQPTVRCGVDSNLSSNAEIMLFASKSRASILKSLLNTNFTGSNDNLTKSTSLNNDSVIVQNIHHENDSAKSANSAKVFNRIRPNPMNITDTLNILNNKTFHTTVKPTNLNKNSLENSDSHSTTNNLLKQIDDNIESFQEFTHTAKHKTNDNQLLNSPQRYINTASTELNTCGIVVKDENSTAFDITQDETTAVDNTDTIKIEEGVVKSEPLDIPKQLEELGPGCTAIIFDIEDPFLVIEISDSSESENEEA